MTTERDADYQNLQRTIAELQVENERLKADQARLDWLESQTKASPQTGISFDWCRYVEDGQVMEHGFRFMRRHFLGERKPTLRTAIDATMAKETQPA